MQQVGKTALGLVLFFLIGVGGGWANDFKLEWTKGWDVTTSPLDWGRSFVSYNQPNSPKSTLNIVAHLEGALPSTKLGLSVHVFGCLETFGQFLASGGCTTIPREGQTAEVTAFEIGLIDTDSFGEGDQLVHVFQLNSGTYQFEIIIRAQDANSPGCLLTGPGANCPAHYQSPGPFAVGKMTLQVP